MRKKMLAVLSVVAALAVAPSAQAAGGCGIGLHRGPAGFCRPNRRGPVVVVPGRPVIGRFYPGRGYWHGHRYWPNRYRWHGSWRYR